MRILHPRAFNVSVFWTLALLYLGSVVHATESSLACPDWPTCFGTMVPEMSGGVFWEHLHRLVAGGLLLMWGLATWLAHKETRETGERRWIVKASVAGIILLLIQSVFGGLTVIFKLPDLVSTTHLSLALLFLSLATLLASRTSWAVRVGGLSPGESLTLRKWAVTSASLVFAQSVVGALVRHTDAGMACPDMLLCGNPIVPSFGNALVTVHFIHRVLGLVAMGAVVGLAVAVTRRGLPAGVRSPGQWAAALAVLQVALGFLSVYTGLAVVPVSLHTLIAASLLATLVHLAAVTWEPTAEPVAERPAVTTASAS